MITELRGSVKTDVLRGGRKYAIIYGITGAGRPCGAAARHEWEWISEMDADSWPLLFLLLLCFVASAFFSAVEMAFMSMNRVRVKSSADAGNARAKRAMYIANNYEQTLNTILIGNNIANIGCAAIATLLVTRIWGARAVAYSTVIVTIAIFFFSEMMPKAIARRAGDRIALASSGMLLFLMRLLKPVAFLFNKWSERVKRRFPDEGGFSYTEEELAEIIETIEDEGVLEPQQQELVQSAFDFGGITAKDILIPMDRVVALDVADTPEQVEQVLEKYKYSRFPVYDARRAHVIGMLSANRFWAARINGQYKTLRALLLPMRSYSKDIFIDDLMQAMNKRRQHMALIREADGTVLGIVTMEDILEELVGEIYDEDDASPEPAAAESGVK